MDGLNDLSPYALTTLERAIAYLKRDRSSEDALEQWAPSLVNAATGRIERWCGRDLAARTRRGTTGISCTTAADALAITGTGFSALKVLDDVVGSGLSPGTRVAAITDDTHLTLSKKATAAATATLTFGSSALVLDGDGGTEVRIPQGPLVEVYSAKWLDLTGSKTSIDLTGARFREGSPGESILTLLSGAYFPFGVRNIEIECKYGYRTPSNTELGDWESWNVLELACLRLVQILWQDFAQAAGRTGEISLVQMSQRMVDFKMPADVVEALAPFRRVG